MSTDPIADVLSAHQHEWFIDSNRPTQPPYYRCSCGHVAGATFTAPHIAPDAHRTHLAERIREELTAATRPQCGPRTPACERLGCDNCDHRGYKRGPRVAVTDQWIADHAPQEDQ